MSQSQTMLQSQTINTRIKKLSSLMINQLSAGEVVTRPASVIKELLENAIDAGATEIKISIKQGGMELIEITDNGCGIHPDDMLMAITRHATSKIADVEQLNGISTLGFRGEALASVSAVSRLTITSSHDDSGVGRCLSVAGKIENPDISPVVCQKGTTISVRDLYFNVPARRGNLKSLTTEYAHIEAVTRHVALVYANINLTLYHDSRCRLNLLANKPSINTHNTSSIPSINRLKQAISTPLPKTEYSLSVDLSCLLTYELHQLNDTINRTSKLQNKPQINGWIWLADNLLTNTDNNNSCLDNESTKSIDLPKLIYINGRLIKDNTISQIVRQTLQSLTLSSLNSPKKVGYALFFSLPPEWLNLNIHPSKQRIKVHALANINVHLQNGLKDLLTPIVEEMVNENKKQKATVVNTESKESKYSNAVIDCVNSKNFAYQTHNPTQFSQVSSPKTAYQVTEKLKSNENEWNEEFNKAQLRLTIWTENQNSKSKAEKLGTLICNQLNIKENFKVEKYSKLNNSYRIDITINGESNQNTTKHMIKLTNTICSPWMVTYDYDIDEISLKFYKTDASTFGQVPFNVIGWATVESLI